MIKVYVVNIIELIRVIVNNRHNRYPQILCEYLNNKHLFLKLFFSSDVQVRVWC